MYKNGWPVIATKITTGEEIVFSAAEWQSKSWVSQTRICQAHSKVASNSLVVIHSARLMIKSINANLVLNPLLRQVNRYYKGFSQHSSLVSKSLTKTILWDRFSFHPQLH